MRAEQGADASGELIQQRLRAEDGPEGLQRDLGPAEVGEEQVGAAEAHIDRHHEPIASPHVQHLGPAATRGGGGQGGGGGFGGRPFVNGAFLEQLVDQGRHDPRSDPHAARQVGARDRLMLAHQVQEDLPVDLPGRGARGAAEIPGIDLSHRR